MVKPIPPGRGAVTEPGRDINWAAWAALACLALAVRPLLFGVTPLLPAVQSDLRMSYSVTALLVAVPVLCLGLASFAGPSLAARFGVVATANLALALMLTAGLARAVLPDAAAILVASIPLGIGAGVAGVLLPMLVKSTVPVGAAAMATSVYTVGMQLGGALAAVAAVPLALVAGGWRPAFGLIAIGSAGAVVAWALLSRRPARSTMAPSVVTSAQVPGRLRWLGPTVAVFSLLVLIFQGLNSWLPALYIQHGWTEAAAGSLLAVLVFAQIPGTLAAGLLADRVGQRRYSLVVPGLVLSAAIALLVVAPQLGWLWATVAGVALGFIAPIALVITLDFGADVQDVGRSTGTVLGIGYVVASVSPLAIGMTRDATGSFAVGLASLCALAIAIAISGLVVPQLRSINPTKGRVD